MNLIYISGFDNKKTMLKPEFNIKLDSMSVYDNMWVVQLNCITFFIIILFIVVKINMLKFYIKYCFLQKLKN